MPVKQFEAGKRYVFRKKLCDDYGSHIWADQIDGREVAPVRSDYAICKGLAVNPWWCEEMIRHERQEPGNLKCPDYLVPLFAELEAYM